MSDLNHKLFKPRERHICTATRQGKWVIHSCPECDYELWDNLKTGEIKVFHAQVQVSHSGSYVPSEMEEPREPFN